MLINEALSSKFWKVLQWKVLWWFWFHDFQQIQSTFPFSFPSRCKTSALYSRKRNCLLRQIQFEVVKLSCWQRNNYGNVLETFLHRLPSAYANKSFSFASCADLIFKIIQMNPTGNPKLWTICSQTWIVSGVMFNHITERMPKWIKQIAFGGMLGVLVYSFQLFNPLAYGFADASTEKNSTMFGLRWLETWEFWWGRLKALIYGAIHRGGLCGRYGLRRWKQRCSASFQYKLCLPVLRSRNFNGRIMNKTLFIFTRLLWHLWINGKIQ